MELNLIMEKEMDLAIGAKVRELNETSSADLTFMYSHDEKSDRWSCCIPRVIITKSCRIYRG